MVRVGIQLNIPIYSSDEAAKKLMVNDQKVKADLIEILGSEIYLPDGELNRKEIANQIFNDVEKKLALERIVHIAVFIDSEQWFKNKAAEKFIYAIYESALLFESHMNHLLNKVIVVTAPEALRIQRVVARSNGMLSEKIKLADFVIHNDNSQMLTQQVLQIHKALLTFALN
mgnify:CR=1 FL=1